MRSNVWAWIQGWFAKYVGGLFMEAKEGKQKMSLGRVSFLLVLLQMMWIWRESMAPGATNPPPLPPGMLEAFYTLSAYVFGSKAVGTVKDMVSKRGGDK